MESPVVVITGASSGIGRAAARRFASEGARVVVAARREDALGELAREIGDNALAVPTDVTDEAAVQRLADAAVERFGGIDVWVNNAGVTLFGRFDEVPHDAYRRVIETNLLGYVHGAWAALPHLGARGGTLVNVVSVNGRVPGPYVSAYVASKHALRGWSRSLRQELRGSDVQVVMVSPASIDTPLFQHAGNFTGRRAKALDPVNDAERVARAIVRAARQPRREVLVGLGARQLVTAQGLAPRVFEAAFARRVERNHFIDEPCDPSAGNLFEAVAEGSDVSGGWKKRDRRRQGRTAAAVAAAAATLAPLTVLTARRQRRGRR